MKVKEIKLFCYFEVTVHELTITDLQFVCGGRGGILLNYINMSPLFVFSVAIFVT